MMRSNMKNLACIAAILLITLGSASAQVPTFTIAPQRPVEEREYPPHTGFQPPSMDLSHITGEELPRSLQYLPAPPARWDWREHGVVTAVQDQGNCPSCYAFAALANIESRLLVEGADSYDFSENNAKECNWYETDCTFGSYLKMANWFSKKGLVLESCDPYVDVDVPCNASCPYIVSLLDWRYISTTSVPSTEVLKAYIYNYGPVFANLYGGDSNDLTWWIEFAGYDGSYTLHYTGSWGTNHSILIVGWDDALTHAGGTGGWIAKNSYGTSWGGACGYGTEDGYFTIAYGSANIGCWASYMHDWQYYDNNGDVLYYDEGGWTGAGGFNNPTAWAMSKFIPAEDGLLTRVEFWTVDATTDIDVYVYDDFDGTYLSNLLDSRLNLSYDEAGYHSVALDTPLPISQGNAVYAAVKVTDESHEYPISVDQLGPYDSGVSYASTDGSAWTELSSLGCNHGIRVRTSGAQTLTVTSPDGGEIWQAQSEQMITWASGGLISEVDIQYSTNGGGSWTTIASSVSNDGSHPWTIPNVSSSNCLVKVSDSADDDPWDQSDAAFTIEPLPTITVISPNGGEDWLAGSEHDITWNSTGKEKLMMTISDVKIEYSADGGGGWETVIGSTPNDGSFPWTIPDTASANCLVKISDAVDGDPWDQSNGTFAIHLPSITVISPNGGESLEGGGLQDIFWSSVGEFSDVLVEYTVNGGAGWTTITASTTNDGSHPWTVPDTPSDSCLVRLSDAVDGDPTDVSDDYFAITPQPTLTVTSPNGGEEWTGGFVQTITWSSVGSVPDVMLEYSTDGGSSWTTILSGTPNDGTQLWSVPVVASTNCLIRISDMTDGIPEDVSDAPFTITVLPTLTVISPNGGEDWSAASSQTITWSSTGSISDLEIEFSDDGGTGWTAVVASTPNDGSHPWVTPATASDSCLVRISDASDGDPWDQSDALFSISVPSLTVVSPNGGEDWAAGGDRDITWTSAGSIDQVKIECSTDDGAGWTSIITVTPNDGHHPWSVPQLVSDLCLVKISDVADEGTVDQSDSAFAISDQTPPSAIGNPWTAATDSSILIGWSPATDNIGVDHYTINFGLRVDMIHNFLADTPDTCYEHIVTAGMYYYEMFAVDSSGNIGPGTVVADSISTAVESSSHQDLPESFRLCQNFPNPFNPVTEIRYDLPRDSRVRLEIYNLLGEKVVTLVDRQQERGSHSVLWNAGSLASGIYLCRLQAGGWSRVNKMVLLK